MEIKEIKTTGLKREFEITITNKSIDQLVQNKISELAPKASIPGFRIGKVPHNILKMRFGKQIFGEVVNESLNNASKKIVDDFKINAATQPKMDIKSFDQGKDMGSPLEFKSEIEFNFAISNNLIFGVTLNHISNANIGSKNPGSDSIFVGFKSNIN